MNDRTDPASSRNASVRELSPALPARASLTRRVLHALITRAVSGPFRISYWDGSGEQYGHGEPRFHLTIRHPSVVWRALLAPDPALGDAYMSGALDVDHLDRLFAALQVGTRRRVLPLGWLAAGLRGASVSRQYREVQAHYDRGDAFFALWLDPTRTYSCAYFESPGVTIEEAQRAKRRHLLRKLQLQPGQRLLDIGCGWGSLLFDAAREYGVHAHGITLSEQQYHFVRRRVDELGLQGSVSVDLADYRELARAGGGYDRVVSVGMLEHVGRRNLPVFMEAVKRLLKPEGVCVLHSITRAQERAPGAWIRRHIFPGSYLPSWREIPALAADYDFHLIDAESLRRHYALTLTHWAERFEAAIPEVRALGFDETFIRMWRLYLRGCAASFRRGWLDLHQWVFTHGISDQLPLTRAHLYGR